MKTLTYYDIQFQVPGREDSPWVSNTQLYSVTDKEAIDAFVGYTKHPAFRWRLVRREDTALKVEEPSQG